MRCWSLWVGGWVGGWMYLVGSELAHDGPAVAGIGDVEGGVLNGWVGGLREISCE